MVVIVEDNAGGAAVVGAREVEDVVGRLVHQFDAIGQPLSRRTVVVPGSRALHVVRRTLLEAGRSDVLAGLDAVTVVELARRILFDADVLWTEGEERIRPARIEQRLRAGLVPHGFSAEAIRRARGWERAFASAITELESHGLRPSELAADADARTRGVSLLWQTIEDSAGSRWTHARIIHEALQCLRRGEAQRPAEGRIVALVDPDLPQIEAALLTAIGDIEWMVPEVRPSQRSHAPAPPLGEATALARLRVGLFSDPRPGALDDSLVLERHDGVDAELDAAARWVAESIERRVPLEEIAVLAVDRDIVPLLRDRIAALGESEELAVHVAGGLPLVRSSGGARILQVLRALESWVDAESMWRLLPHLTFTVTDDEGTRTRSLVANDAWAIAFQLGTLGGHAAAPLRAREWPVRARARIEQLRLGLADTQPVGKAVFAHDHQARLRLSLEQILPALDAVDDAMAAILDGRPLAEVWAAVRRLLTDHVRGGASQATHLLGTVIEEDASTSGLSGSAALSYMIELALGLRASTSRFGDPAVFVGLLGAAMHLRFRAVRIVGLAEGTVPPRVRPDVVLSDDVRVRLGLSRGQDRVAHVRRRFHGAVLAATETLVLSCPRVGFDRVVRQPAPVLVEVLRAVADAPHVRDDLRHAFDARREQAHSARVERPLVPHDRLLRAAKLGRCPANWMDDPVLGLAALGASNSGILGPSDGLVGSEAARGLAAGLGPDRPLSASGLGELLKCPWRWLLARGLSWREPSAPPSATELDAMAFGSFVHAAIETFSREHGDAFERRDGTLDDHLRQMDAIAESRMTALRDSTALWTDDAWHALTERARQHLRAFLEHEWHRAAGQALEPERGFGYAPDEPVELVTANGSVWVRGSIDRMRIARDSRGPVTEVWDVKTGKRRTVAMPDHLVDAQIGLYLLVARARASAWNVPARVEGGYVYTNFDKGHERVFRGVEADDLASQTLGWLGIARHMLEDGVFPRTPRDDDCTYCDMRIVCGPRAPVRAHSLLARAHGPLRELARLKGVEDDDGGDTNDGGGGP